MDSRHTLPEHDLPWTKAAAEEAADALHVTIAWSLEEPGRVGETATVRGLSLLGRGDALADDAAPRLAFRRARAGKTEARPPLASPRVSRAQLLLAPRDGGLHVTMVGRCPLLINGVETAEGDVNPGDTLQLRNALVLLVERRPAYLPGDDTLRAYPPFAFGGPDDFGLVGESAAAWRLREDVAFAARSDRHVLLLGESGAGKELAARAIHALSRRAARPMVARNASTLPPGIVDAELFGSAKNYPNAGMPERAGLIGEADGTTLLLDEIGELPLEQQAHLLRVLDSDGEYQRLGEGRVRRSSFRLVAATNRPPESLKSDFLARFAVRVTVPGLAQRREDIPLLTRLLLGRAADGQPELGQRFFETRAGARAEPRVHPDLIDALVRHQFTTHTRELEHLLWTALSTSRDEFVALTEAVSSALALTGHPVAAPAPERAPEREEIVAALAAANGNVTNAARALGLSSRFVLYRLMRRHGLGAD